MTTINALSRADVLYDTDEIPLFSPTQRDTRKATLPQLAAYVYSVLEGEPDETVYALVTSGDTFTVTALSNTAQASVWVLLTLSAPASFATIIMPGMEDRSHGQEVLVTCTQAIASVTVSGNGATVRGAPISLATDGFFKLRFDSISTTWYRVS